MVKKKCTLQFAIMGLGRFGMNIVKTLADYDVDILACDKDPEPLHEAAEFATHVVQADVGDEDAMKKIGLGNFDVVVFAMGGDFEASVMGIMSAKDMGAGRVIAKAYDHRQKKIYESLGVDKVIMPELDMGARVAKNLVDPNIVDEIEHSGKYTVTEMLPEKEWLGITVGESDIRRKYGILLLAVIRGNTVISPVMPDEILNEGDILIALQDDNIKE